MGPTGVGIGVVALGWLIEIFARNAFFRLWGISIRDSPTTFIFQCVRAIFIRDRRTRCRGLILAPSY